MPDRTATKPHAILRGGETDVLEFLEEEPLLIKIDGRPYLVVMRTPGDEVELAAGFCLGEGIVDTTGDMEGIEYDEGNEPNVVDIRLRRERHDMVRNLLERRRFVSQSSCGICGKGLIEDLYQDLTPAETGLTIGRDRVVACLRAMDERQEYYESTRCSHAALLFDERSGVISFAEDVGRHNGLDKAIGKAFLAGALARACLVVLSSRNSYELIQKAARARLQIMLSKSRPTALAIELGESLNMTLAFADKGELVVVCGGDRILA